MKNIIKISLASVVLVATFASCKKDENKIYFEGGTAPVLTSSVASGGTLPLSYANKDLEALRLSWTNPNYKFTTGLSSQDVSYLVEIDTAGANFTNPQKQTVAISKDLGQSFTNGTFNDYLLNQLALKPGIPHNLEIRVKSNLANSTATLISNVIKLATTPYAIPPKVTPPASGELYITGSAVPSDWTNTPPAAQKFDKLSPTLFELTVTLTGGNSYTFLPTYGSWNDKYSIAKKNDPASIYGGDFQWQGEDILAPPSTGSYKIQVDFQRGKFTVTKL